jgi:hypothetical protein
MTRIKFPSILRYLQDSDLEYFKVVQKQLKAVEQTDEQTDELIAFDILEKVVMGLPINKFDSYTEWIKVVCAVTNIGLFNDYERKANNLLHQWSEQSVLKYDGRALDKFIMKVADYESVTYATLCYYLKLYNFDLFKEICMEKPTYDNMKKIFEKHTFKILNPVCYVSFIEGSKNFSLVKESDVVAKYRHMSC